MPIYIGVMTGTSIDGLDIAAIELEPSFKLIAGADYPLPDDLRQGIIDLARSDTISWQTYGRVDAALGEFIGHKVLDFIAANALDRDAITAVGSHGQTVHHSPDTTPAFTVQLGDASRISAITGLTVVSDFRSADMAAGGQGAPLVPPFHQRLFHNTTCDTAVCNIGGIANITLLPGDSTLPLIGFDTGPGNTLLDAWCKRHTGDSFDRDGVWGASAEANAQLLSALLGDPFVQQAPPKSTGVEHYNLSWLEHILNRQELTTLAPNVVQATLCEFTARSISHSVRASLPNCEQLILCGGGRRNGDLVKRLQHHSKAQVLSCDEHTIDGDLLEAAAFAWLASQTLNGLPGNAPSVTGANKPMRLGTVTAPLP